MLTRHFLRNSIRTIKAQLYALLYGNEFSFRGIQISLPAKERFYARKQIKSGLYEKKEADFIEKYLPADQAVIELGGSLGLISAFIRTKLNPKTPHLVVEANPNILPICKKNTSRYDTLSKTVFLNAALFYEAKQVNFQIGKNIHANSIYSLRQSECENVTVQAVTLNDCLAKVGAPERASLIVDIEGAEFSMFLHGREDLKRFDPIIIENHPTSFANQKKSEKEFFDLVLDVGLEVVDRDNDVLVLQRKKI